jgi:hypothetical protein
MDPS